MQQLSIYLLGPLQVRLGDSVITRVFRTEKERALLAFLAVERERSHSRDTLAELFWPERPQGVGRTNLRQALSGLRKTLGDRQQESPILLTDDESARINPEREVWLDVDAFRSLYQETMAHDHPSLDRCPTCAANLGKLVDLYRDDFLIEFTQIENPDFQEWVFFHREHFYSNLLVAMGSLVGYYREAGDLERAQTYARRYVNIAPLEENAHRQMMEILALSGRRSAAIEQYQQLKRLLAEELTIEPSPETQVLYEYIKEGSRLAPVIPTTRPERHTLPQPMTTFVGRQQELEWFKECLPNPICRLITIVGQTGVGKTRLVLQAASMYAHLFKDGVHYVPLEAVHNTNQLFANIASVLGIQLRSGEMAYNQVVETLRPLHVLLVLDHFEHLMEATELLLNLLKNATHVKLLITTQRRLDYQAACIYHLEGLPYPQSWDIHNAAEFPAVELFITRAGRSRSTFQLRQENLPHVLRIIHMARGLPLAIELAAARTRDYSVEYIAERMARDLDVLRTTQMDVPARHRSLSAAFRHSCDMLSDAERSLFYKLSVFESPITLQAAEAIASASIANLTDLAGRSLLEGDATRGYTFHPLVKRYAADELAAFPNERQAVYERHARYYLNYLFEHEGELADARSARQAVEEIGLHLKDVYQAVEWAKEQQDEAAFKHGIDALRSYFETCVTLHDRHCNFWKVELALLENGLDLHLQPIGDRIFPSLEYCCGRMGCLEEANQAYILENESQEILEVNFQACQLSGYTRAEMLDLRTDIWEPDRLHAAELSNQHFETLLERADGSRIQVEVTHTRFNLGGDVYYFSSMQPAYQGAELPGLMGQPMTHDALTDLPNREEFYGILRAAVSRAARQTRRLAVLHTDVDQLSTINKAHGYQVGDSILQAVAERLRQTLRSDDVIARVTGDAFGVLVDPLFKVEHAAAVARKVLSGLNGEYALEDETLKLSFSIGICIYPEGGSSAENLMTNAEEALQQAKVSAQSDYQVYPLSAFNNFES